MFLVIFSSLLCPFVAHGMFELVAGKQLAVDMTTVFNTLVWLIFLPVIAHLPFRHRKGAFAWFKKNNKALVIPMVAGTFVLAIAHQREYLLRKWQESIVALIVSFFVFQFFYVSIWFFGRKSSRHNRISYTLSSGLDNISLEVVPACCILDLM